MRSTDLVGLVGEAEVLEEPVGQLHQLVHAHVLLAVEGDLQEVQDHLVHAHVAQETLLVHARLQRAHCNQKGWRENRNKCKDFLQDTINISIEFLAEAAL